jgi:RimJ/RimL family protein N-acetyltransferase
MSSGTPRTTTDAGHGAGRHADAAEIRLTGHGVVLREWTDEDLPVMVELFDEPAVAYRTPLVSPFGLPAARDYLAMVRRARAGGERIHLAITTDGGRALGEVMINLAQATIGYVVGTAHRGQGLAVRAVRVLTGYAHEALGVPRLCAQIEPGNHSSVAVAEAAGYRPTGGPPEPVEDKGRCYTLLTWVHEDAGTGRA